LNTAPPPSYFFPIQIFRNTQPLNPSISQPLIKILKILQLLKLLKGRVSRAATSEATTKAAASKATTKAAAAFCECV
jgi:hypothetical protein